MDWEDLTIISKESHKCAVCGNLTNKLCTIFECALCSVDCYFKLNKEYIEANQELGKIEVPEFLLTADTDGKE